MEKNQDLSFEDIFKQNERRIYYHIQRLGIRDVHREFYVEGMYAMWMAYKKYEPDKGPLATYFNYTIRNRLIDLVRKKTNDGQRDEKVQQAHLLEGSSGNSYGGGKLLVTEGEGIELADDAHWQEIKGMLTEKQWKWVYYYVILDMPLKEIAEQENATIEAVKSWGKEARKKLKGEYGEGTFASLEE
ncbi:sigma-70 family RNA polymerase sigma factor [Oceanobacillus rekensis]|uniref:sigma-70 family RNA polymerase sigma factor n=1 Tax=Oceanobacillus rekensis TaxID=937927 RepID=UPI000B43EF54|nr:sigma-70 family RNA polymerase sigma factor [Oceanobacillus rekensis]